METRMAGTAFYSFLAYISASLGNGILLQNNSPPFGLHAILTFLPAFRGLFLF